MPTSAMSDTWPARFPGYCIRCSTRFVAGTPVGHVEGEGVVHAECPDPLHVSQVVCPIHFVEVAATGVCSECE